MKKIKKIVVKKIVKRRTVRKSVTRNAKPYNTLDQEIISKINDYKINDTINQLSERISLTNRVSNGEKISIIVACMNRYDNLAQCVKSWIDYDEPYEIIILDYGSKVPLETSGIHKLSNRIKLYRTEATHWHLTRAYNIAAQYVTGDIILKMDSDYIIKSEFFNHKLEYNSFIYGGHGVGALYGFLCLYKNLFFLLNGYNERIINYGYDDKDLFLRCQYVAGMRPIKINKKTLFHIPHTDHERTQNQNTKEHKYRSMAKNIKISRLYPWSIKDTITNKDVAFRII